MDQLQIIQLKSSWNVQGPYDVSSILKYTFGLSDGDNSTECNDRIASNHTMHLIPPQTEDNSQISCQMWLSCQQDVRTLAIEIISSARNVEFYDDKGGYCCTVRGDKQTGEEGQQEAVYKTKIVTERPLLSCSFKFLSLADKVQLHLKSLNVKLSHQSDDVASYGGSINMTRVREMMSSMPQPVSDRVENLMQTVEQYQKNQASVMEDLQHAALSRTLTSKDPMASQMTGLLSVLAKASSMHSDMAQRSPQSRTMHQGAGAASAMPDNTRVQVPSQASNESTQEMETQDSTTQVLEKLMSTLSTTGASGNARELANNPDFYSAMQGMCRDLNKMKAHERRVRAARNMSGSDAEGVNIGSPDDGQEKETSEIPQEKYQSSVNNSHLELRLLGYVAAMEERLMGRLERKLQEVKDHMDVRLNTLEALLLEKSCAKDEKDARIKEDTNDLQEDNTKDLQEDDLD